MARASEYNPSVGEAICCLVREGSNLDQIGRMDEFPAKSTIYCWLDRHPDFADDYAVARARRADARSDRIDDIGRQLLAGEITSDVARVLVDIEKWQAGKENPKRYGEKTLHTGADGVEPVSFTLNIARRDKGD